MIADDITKIVCIQLDKTVDDMGVITYKEPRLTFYHRTREVLSYDEITGAPCHFLVVTVSMDKLRVVTIYPAPHMMPYQ